MQDLGIEPVPKALKPSTEATEKAATAAERRAERLAKWEWSDEFLAKARPDKGNYGQGDLFDDGLTKLERAQIEQGREAYLTGGAKLRYKRLTGQI